jgi:hypothetical protein
MALGISISYNKATYAALQRAADALRVDEPGEATIVDNLLDRIDLAREHAEAVVTTTTAARHGRRGCAPPPRWPRRPG